MIPGKVRDILVPIADFPCISQDASVRDAFALLHTQHKSGGWRFRHMLALDEAHEVVGVVSLQDLLQALMPDYIKASLNQPYRMGDGTDALDTTLSLLWQDAFQERCRLGALLPVSSCMTPVRFTLSAGDPVTRAAYLMIAQHIHMLPVLEAGRVIGVVRIVDVFNTAAGQVLGD
jgi:CBS domain-containing protein